MIYKRIHDLIVTNNKNDEDLSKYILEILEKKFEDLRVVDNSLISSVTILEYFIKTIDRFWLENFYKKTNKVNPIFYLEYNEAILKDNFSYNFNKYNNKYTFVISYGKENPLEISLIIEFVD